MTESELAVNERTWNLLRNVGVEEALHFASNALSSCEPCRDAAALAVAELSENLLKYSARSADARAGSIGISLEGKQIRVRSLNTVAAPADALVVMRLLSQITPANVGTLYRARMMELFNDHMAQRTQLGLLRIGYEGGFVLSCSYEAPLLEILAERTCEGAHEDRA